MDYMANTFYGRAERHGIDIGIKQEREESYREKINMVKDMLNDLPNEKISRYTKMPIEEIAKIREEYSTQ